MADRYDIEKSSSLHRQDRNNGAETRSREDNFDGLSADATMKYNFDGLQRYAADLSTKVHIHEHILKSFNQELVLLERCQMSAQTMALSKNTQYDTEFLREQSYNMSIIDLKTDSEADHLNITRFLKSSLLHSSGGTRKPMIIHIFCYHGSQMLTPLHLSVILLQSILKRLYRNRYIDWKPIEVVCNGIGQNWVDYEITMELLKVLISRVLKDYPEDTMHFVFGGIRSSHLDEKQRLGLARFMIAMGGLVRAVLPQGDMGKVKCAFSRNALFEGVLPYLESEREKTRGVPEQEEIFGQMLMLALYKDGCQNFYYERVRFSE